MSISIHSLNQPCACGLLLFSMPLSITSLAAVPMGDHRGALEEGARPLSGLPGHISASSPLLEFPHLPLASPSPSPSSNHWESTNANSKLTLHLNAKTKQSLSKSLGSILMYLQTLQPAAQCFSLSSERAQHPVLESPFVQLRGSGSLWKPKEGKKHGSWEESPFERWTDNPLLNHS